MGYAGQISIGHAAFFAIGGYTGGGSQPAISYPSRNRGPCLIRRTGEKGRVADADLARVSHEKRQPKDNQAV